MEDVKDARQEATLLVEANIKSLLQNSTLYLLATSYGGQLARLVYLRRALNSSSTGAYTQAINISQPST